MDLRDDNGHKEQPRRSHPVWPSWYASLTAYRKPRRRTTIWQLANTLLPYGGLWFLMVWMIQRRVSYALILPLVVLAAGFLVRIFILFHDCVHGSLFASKTGNNVAGYALGALVFTSLADWRFSHLRHHATYANLDSRGLGDVWTMTRQEFATASWRKRWAYRIYRNPFLMLVFGPIFTFMLLSRLPASGVGRRERLGVLLTDLLIGGMFAAVALLAGWRIYLLIQLPVLWLAGAGGIALFYVQHQFEGVYWARKAEWDPVRAAMEGCSFLELPPVLRWFSGSIGYHHVHHLGARIPNYRLKACHDAIPALRAKPSLSFIDILACFRLKLWDEEHGRLTGYSPFPVGTNSSGRRSHGL